MAQTFIKYGPPDNPKYPKDSCGNFLHRGIFNANPNQIALIDPDKNVTISYGDLQKVTSKLAKRLKKAGIRKGDIVTIISENRTEFLVAVISTLYVGATITVLNPDYTKNELQNQLRNYTPSIIFCSKKVLERLQSLKISSEIIIFDQDFKSNGIKNYSNFLQDVQDEDTGDYLEENVDVDDTAVVFTSSGTTGFPKSVQITHRNLRIFYVYLREREYGDFKDGLKSLGYLPFFHMLGLGLAFASLCSSNQLILMERFAPEKFFQNIAKYKINCMVGVPTILLFMQRTPLLDQYDCTSLSQVIYGSAPAPVEVLQKLSERLNGCSFQHVYGMTEAAGVVLMMPKERSGDKPGSVGTPVHTFVVKVCDIETGAILGPNQTGEIRIKGDGVMKGYFNDPKATQDSFDEDGFMKTGDVGYYDNDDFFYIVDRLKELIKYKSFQVPPAELESLIVNYPGVQEVVVVGKPDERAGELPTAIVVKIPNSKITEQDIVKYVSENLSVQKQLHGGVIFVDSITKTTTGKIMRKQIRDKLFSVLLLSFESNIIMSASFIKEGPPDHSSIPKVGVGKMFHQKNLERNPSKIALVNPKNGEEINYKTVLDVTTKLAKVLVEKGVTKNDFVTIISHNCSEFLMTFLATWYTGAKLTLLNPDYTSGEYAHFFDLYVPKIIFCSENVTDTFQNLKNLLKGTEIIIIDSDNSKKGFQLYQDLLESCVNDQTKFLNENINPETDTALILSSSGTTGLPKSVMLSHSNLRTFLAHLGDSNIGNMTETGTSLAFLPFFHIFGIGSALASLFHGTKSIIMGKFNPHEFFSYIETYKITNLYTVPSILQFIAKSPLTEKYDLSSLQDIVYGSAPVSAEIVQDITRKINKCTKIRQAYGMTETTGIITLVPINSQKFIGTVGKPANTVALKVCDAKTGEILGPNQSGEIRVKSGGVMLGYLGNVQATKDAFDDEGFLKTGDLGYYDEEDHFHIVDRLKELIKFKGFQVAPAELEGILMQHVGVLEAGVVGKPDDRAGELPTAFIVKNPKIDVTEEQLVGFVAERVSVPKHLHGGVVFLEKLPRNATGKLNRNELRDLLLVQ